MAKPERKPIRMPRGDAAAVPPSAGAAQREAQQPPASQSIPPTPQSPPQGSAGAIGPAERAAANRPVPVAGGAAPIPVAAAGSRPVPVGQAAPGIGALRGQQSMAAKVKGDDTDEEEVAAFNENPLLTWCKKHSDWLTSAGVHAVLLLILGLILLPGRLETGLMLLSTPNEDLALDDLDQQAEFNVSQLNDKHPNELVDLPPEAPDADVPVVNMIEQGAQAMQSVEPDYAALVGNLVGSEEREGIGRGQSDAGSGTGLGGRGQRRAGAMGLGASKASEDAVELALKWLAEHQQPDGSWCFDHRVGSCNGRCGNPGTGVAAKNGATGLALLPFLGAGYTHLDGKYKRTVAGGLQYLIRAQQHTADGGSFYEPEGKMYSHGLATLALCEAHGMARERGSSGAKARALSDAAQAALKFIEYAQNDAGGWRYEPKMAGDTSVLSWQLMALKSGSMAYLPVNEAAFQGAGRFLDSVQSGTYGEKYGYTAPGETNGTTAIGLLCRMYMGWKRDRVQLERGIEFLSETGPSTGNMYYNYYATQAMFHYTNGQGEMWKKWNEQMRDFLVAQQMKGDHVGGSWFLRGGEDLNVGGRVYYTCLACMTLEVYYRHMPIYGNLDLGN